MSTPNFITQSDFDMYIIDFEPLSEEEQKQYEIDNDCKYDEELEAEWFLDDEIKNFNWLLQHYLKENKRELKFCNIELRNGHYTGVQTYVDILYDPREYDNDTCKYEHGLCRSKAIRALQSEINFINKKLFPYIRDNSSFEKLICIGIFSNGEAVYKYADRVQTKEIA